MSIQTARLSYVLIVRQPIFEAPLVRSPRPAGQRLEQPVKLGILASILAVPANPHAKPETVSGLMAMRNLRSAVLLNVIPETTEAFLVVWS